MPSETKTKPNGSKHMGNYSSGNKVGIRVGTDVEMIRRLANEGLTQSAIARIVGVSVQTVMHHVRRNEIDVTRKAAGRPRREAKEAAGASTEPEVRKDRLPRALLKEMVDEGLSVKAIAQALESSAFVVQRDAKHYGLEPKPGTPHRFPPKYGEEHRRKLVEAMEADMSRSEAAEYAGVNIHALRHRLEGKWGLSFRSEGATFPRIMKWAKANYDEAMALVKQWEAKGSSVNKLEAGGTTAVLVGPGGMAPEVQDDPPIEARPTAPKAQARQPEAKEPEDLLSERDAIRFRQLRTAGMGRARALFMIGRKDLLAMLDRADA